MDNTTVLCPILFVIPLLEFARFYLALDHSRFYTPGHKGGQGLAEAWQELLPNFRDMGSLDLPELVGFEEALTEAETLASQAHNCDRSYFLTNGATAGVQSALLAVVGDGEQILVGRNCHRSTIGGLIMTGAVPIYLPCEWDQAWQVDLGVSPETVADYLGRFPSARAVILVSPNYFGIAEDVTAIAKLCHDRQIPLIIDSAHGSHWGYHQSLPASPIACGADLVIHSHHKTLTALSQGAMLNCQGQLVDRSRLHQSVRTLQSTSPNFLILLSLDIARQQMQDSGPFLLDRLLELVEKLRCRSPLAWFRTDRFALDWTRITVRSGRITGFQADSLLTERLGVICEMPTLQNLVFSLSVGTSPQDVAKLGEAFDYLQAYQPPLDSCPSEWSGAIFPQVSPRQAFFSPRQSVPIHQAIDRVSADTLCPYPPGIPVVGIGEKITPEAISYLQTIHQLGGVINGASDPDLQYLSVVQLD